MSIVWFQILVYVKYNSYLVCCFLTSVFPREASRWYSYIHELLILIWWKYFYEKNASLNTNLLVFFTNLTFGRGIKENKFRILLIWLLSITLISNFMIIYLSTNTIISHWFSLLPNVIYKFTWFIPQVCIKFVLQSKKFKLTKRAFVFFCIGYKKRLLL